ncbi:MAG: S8 family serine peptidase, partial [Coriobacteriia bacterium]|nr:S8 family serine peptidase [Coriobacteriia bacterium]
GDGAYSPDQILVSFKPGTAAWDRAGAHASLGTKAKGRIPQIDVEIVDVPKDRSVEGLVKMYEKNPNVVFAEPDHTFSVTSLVPDDAYYSYQRTYMESIAAPGGWSVATGASDVVIAILDTGVSGSHGDLKGRLVAGRDVVNSDDDASDDHGHGTSVAGIAAANGNNAFGIAGIDWGARIMPVKVLNASGSGSASGIAAGIVWAADNGADVINMSLGGPSSNTTFQAACDYAYGKGVVLVAAAGNDGVEQVRYPAAYKSVIAVGALAGETRASFSCYGEGLELSAPGSRTYTTTLSGAYGYFSGTSAASPFVAGLAGLVLSVNGSLAPAEVRTVLANAAVDLGAPGWDKEYGWGKISVERSVLAAGGEPPGPAPDPDSTAPTVAITNPGDGSAVSGNVVVAASASDDRGVSRVDFFLNGTLLGSSSSEPYSVRWNTRKSAEGAYRIEAVALDTSGNVARASVDVTLTAPVKNTPPKKK